MPVYSKGPKIWRVRIFHQGKRRDWIVHGTKRDAELYEARMRTELARGETPTSARVTPTLERYCAEHYVPHLQTMVAPSTLRVRLWRLEALLARLGDRKLDALDVAVPGYQKQRRQEGREPSTINDEIKVLRAVVNHARGTGLLVPALKSRFLRVPKRVERVAVWTPEQMRHMFAVCAAEVPRLLPLITLAAHTGMRPGETLRLRMRSVDLTAGLLWVEPSEEWAPKDREARSIPIGDELRPWLQRREGQEWYAPSNLGKPFAVWPPLMWRKLLQKSGVGGHPHMFRHTYASMWLRAGGDIFTLSKVLGHSDIRLTLDTYSHLMPGHLQAQRGLVTYGSDVLPASAEAAARWRKH